MIAPESLLGRALSIMALCLMFGVVWLIVCAPLIRSVSARQAEISLLEVRYEKFAALVTRGVPEDHYADVAPLVILEAPSQAGAQAALQSLVRTMALGEGVNVRSISAGGVAEGDVAIVSITVSAETDLSSLVNFLHRITTTEQQMWSKDLDVRSNDWAAQGQAQTRLDFRISIQAPWQVIGAGDIE